MFCPQCGASNADTSIVCVQCGRNLRPGVPATPMQPMQPMQPVGTVMPPPVQVQNYLVFAILTTVFCCLPAGIPAIVYAAQVNGKLQAGDFAGAKAASDNAKMWCWVSLGLGLGVGVIYGILMMVGVLGSMHN